jgi:regulator of sigma E protease
MTTVLSFIFVLGVLIFFHELGHFLVAKWAGVRVEKFSLGFPPNIFAKKWGDTTYCIGLIPLGGYVKMLGENPDEESTGAPDEYMSKPVWKRFLIILAGPFMNYLLAVVILAGIIFFVGKPLFDNDRVLVGEIVAGHPADLAGMKVDDQIIAINGEMLASFDSLRARVNAQVGVPIEVTWLHGGDTNTATMTTAIAEQPNIKGGIDSVGVIGFGQKVIGYDSFGLLASFSSGFATTNRIGIETVKFVKRTVTGEVSAKLIGGPLFIAQQSGREAEKGPSSLFFFMALLSVNLCILNILPIPVLDGGQLVFLAIEKLKGKPLSMKARMAVQQVGVVFLLLLIVMVTYNDVMRFFSG